MKTDGGKGTEQRGLSRVKGTEQHGLLRVETWSAEKEPPRVQVGMKWSAEEEPPKVEAGRLADEPMWDGV